MSDDTDEDTHSHPSTPSLAHFKRPGVSILITSLFFFYLGYGVLQLSGPDSFLLAVCRRTLQDPGLNEHSSVCQTDEIHTQVAFLGGRLRAIGTAIGLLLKIHLYKLSDRYGRKPVIIWSMVSVWCAYLLQWVLVTWSLEIPLYWWVVPNVVFCTHYLVDFFLIYLADSASASKGKLSLQQLATDVSFFYAFILFLGALVGPALASAVAENATGSTLSELSKLGLILVFAGMACVIVILPESTTKESRDRAKVKWDAEWSNLSWSQKAVYLVNFVSPVKTVIAMAHSVAERRKNSFLLAYLSLMGLYGTAQHPGFLFYKRQWNWGVQQISQINVETTIVLILSQVFLGPLYINTAERLLNNSTSSTPVAILGCKIQGVVMLAASLIQLIFSSQAMGALMTLLTGLSGTFISSTIALQMGLGPPENMSTIMAGIGVARSLVAIPGEIGLAILFVWAMSTPRTFLSSLGVIDAVGLTLLQLASAHDVDAGIRLDP